MTTKLILSSFANGNFFCFLFLVQVGFFLNLPKFRTPAEPILCRNMIFIIQRYHQTFTIMPKSYMPTNTHIIVEPFAFLLFGLFMPRRSQTSPVSCKQVHKHWHHCACPKGNINPSLSNNQKGIKIVVGIIQGCSDG